MTKLFIPALLVLFLLGCAGNQSSSQQLAVWGRIEGDASEKRLLNDIYECNMGAVNKAKRDVIFYGLGYGSETLNEEYLIPCMTHLKGWYLMDKLPWPVETNMTESEYKKARKPATY
jgi:hypothetical protein